MANLGPLLEAGARLRAARVARQEAEAILRDVTKAEREAARDYDRVVGILEIVAQEEAAETAE